MKIRSRGSDGEKIETQMAPMIDVVFQLLIFFMLTLKIIEPEGDFSISMPLGQASTESSDEPQIEPLKIRLRASADGALAEVLVNGQTMGVGPEAFLRVNAKVYDEIVGLGDQADELEVEIDPDYGVPYSGIIATISACSGRIEDEEVTRFVSKIKFAPIREEAP